jgi:phosphoribosylformimino-5-aminoimidazole carboxamide ribotide isomerase
VELIPAIDLLGGAAVRLAEGDYARQVARDDDAVARAVEWARAGARRIHVVDLEGARQGRPVELRLVARLVASVRGAIPGTVIELGGGLRTIEDLAAALGAGVDDVVIGTAAIESPTLVADAAARFPGRIGVSLDLRDARPAIDGWTRTVAVDPRVLAADVLAAGATRLTLTDAGRDGTLAGPNLEMLARFRQAFPSATLIAAGGVGSVDDLAALAAIGIDGVIVGRALLDGSLSIRGALEAVS